MSEIEELLGIVKTENNVEMVDTDYPFNHLDKDNVYKYHMKDGTIDIRKSPFKRYSTYLSNFNQAAEKFGYTLGSFTVSSHRKDKFIYDGYWLFKHTDYDYPYITVRPGYVHNDYLLCVNIEHDDRVELKTYQDCFNHINRRLEHLFKRKKIISRDYKLVNLFENGIL